MSDNTVTPRRGRRTHRHVQARPRRVHVIFAAIRRRRRGRCARPVGVGTRRRTGLRQVLTAPTPSPISGAHFNPAVSVGAAMSGRLPWSRLPLYIVSQVVGGLLGGTLIFVVASGKAGFEATGGMAANGYGAHSPDGYSLLSALLIEIVLTALFVWVILGATDRRAPVGFAPAAIGLTLTLSPHLDPDHQHLRQPGQFTAWRSSTGTGPRTALAVLAGAHRGRAHRRRAVRATVRRPVAPGRTGLTQAWSGSAASSDETTDQPAVSYRRGASGSIRPGASSSGPGARRPSGPAPGPLIPAPAPESSGSSAPSVRTRWRPGRGSAGARSRGRPSSRASSARWRGSASPRSLHPPRRSSARRGPTAVSARRGACPPADLAPPCSAAPAVLPLASGGLLMIQPLLALTGVATQFRRLRQLLPIVVPGGQSDERDDDDQRDHRDNYPDHGIHGGLLFRVTVSAGSSVPPEPNPDRRGALPDYRRPAPVNARLR